MSGEDAVSTWRWLSTSLGETWNTGFLRALRGTIPTDPLASTSRLPCERIKQFLLGTAWLPSAHAGGKTVCC